MAPKETAYYDLLGVSPTATPAEIRKAFRVLALRHHPDRAGSTPESTAAFTHLRAVHDVLIDPALRAEYDSLGDRGGLHGCDPAADSDVAAAFFAAAGPRLSPEDIARYETTYRDGDDEREDLRHFYTRFDGRVTNVLEYIPYSDYTDLTRFVRFWDACLEDGSLDPSTQYTAARKHLLRKGKGKDREIAAASPPALPASPASPASPIAAAGTKQRPVRGKGSAKKKEGGAAGANSDLVAQLLARQQSRRAQFDDWADGLAERAEQRASTPAKRQRTRKAAASPRKKRRSARKPA